MTDDEAVTLVVTLQAEAECSDRLRDELRVLAASSREDAGCIRFDLLEQVDAPGRFVLVEEWLGESRLVRHNSSAHVARFRETSPPLIAVPMQVQRLRGSV